MAELLQVEAGERGTLRIFSIEMEAAERRKILAPKADTAPTGAALGALLGVDWIDPDHADLFDVAELDDLGLIGFLTQGAGVSADDLSDHRTQLDSLEGTILIVYARGFTGEATVLDPAPNVTPVLILNEAQSTIQFEPLQSAAAEGQLTQNTPAPKSPHLTLLVAILALPILALIIGAVLWGILR